MFLKTDLRAENITLSEIRFSSREFSAYFNLISCVAVEYRFSTVVMRAACPVSFVQTLFVFVTFFYILLL